MVCLFYYKYFLIAKSLYKKPSRFESIIYWSNLFIKNRYNQKKDSTNSKLSLKIYNLLIISIILSNKFAPSASNGDLSKAIKYLYVCGPE